MAHHHFVKGTFHARTIEVPSMAVKTKERKVTNIKLEKTVQKKKKKETSSDYTISKTVWIQRLFHQHPLWISLTPSTYTVQKSGIEISVGTAAVCDTHTHTKKK